MEMESVRARSNKREESDENDPSDSFSNILVELKVEILQKLPPKPIGRLGLVSKHWSSMISGKEFTEMYLSRFSAQPRLLFSVYCPDMQMQFFHSCSQEDPSSDHRRVSYTLNSDLKFDFYPPIRGLIFGRNGTEAMIGNPSTGQFLSLPRVETTREEILSIFGYDPVNDVYKVLCMTIRKPNVLIHYHAVSAEQVVMSEEHQVFTLGADQEWRMVECRYPHGHYSGTEGICRNGVLYYLASFNNKRSLICFNLSSEDFSVIILPEYDELHHYGCLVNYTGKIVIVTKLPRHLPFDIWVLEDPSKEKWSKVAVVGNMIGMTCPRFTLRGMFRTGEVILAPVPTRNPFFFLCYHLRKSDARKVVIEGIGDNAAAIQVFFDFEETPMILPKVK